MARRGLRTVLRCSEACVLRIDTFLGRKAARRLGFVTRLSKKRIGSAYARLASARGNVVVVRLSRSAARRLNRARRRRAPASVHLYVRIRAADLAGNQRKLTRTILLR